ncbi:hypothetical protein K6U20_00885 [Vibrio fluvialis]|uniref:hypothetical protein n=1 Tax=Vibrio fluvialis TaxID=676 RepID=UPI001C9C5C8E|nr:hypothetical protein [Vibrio fluvialis]EKA7384898.1 hypothetical protein [Vibrio parahaemolyticus]MBY7869167.1 hypothetical protein [Vibrio fluvialis]MBY7919704.1 hypothetical protein [Vibrio fluvialis]MBY8273865.1 hypothetical protein [Vibrio fluvialis]MCG6403189.1 hypothetical protein [Vibrio fluvialis]
MDSKDREKMAFEYAKDTTKQLMTLATGFIALTVTFSKDFIGSAPDDIQWKASVVWVLLLISVVFGQVCLMTLTGVLGTNKKPLPPLNIYKPSIKYTAAIQAITFFVGMGFGIVFAINAM